VSPMLEAVERWATDLCGSRQQEAVELLSRYAHLLARWAPRVNLVAVADLPHLLERHLGPALHLRPVLQALPHRRIVDVGSGAGLPALPLAITMPGTHWTLVESRRRRVSFLRQAVRELELQHAVDVVGSRVEDWIPEMTCDVVTSRAVAEPMVLDRLAAHTLTSGGFFLTTRGPRSDGEALPVGPSLCILTAGPTLPTRLRLYRPGKNSLKAVEKAVE
jgi:16S rRNA (guanine527-N7)-methyltransferase